MALWIRLGGVEFLGGLQGGDADIVEEGGVDVLLPEVELQVPDGRLEVSLRNLGQNLVYSERR